MTGAYLRPSEARLRGQASAIDPKTVVKAEQDLASVREHLGKLDQESIRAHNARLDLQADYLTVLQRTANASQI